MSQHIQLGQEGEELATSYLRQRGFEVIERNWRCHAGEVDIIASDGDTVVIVEVKTRRSTHSGHPFEALTPTKIARLYRLAVLWCVAHNWRGEFRVDAIAIIMHRNAEPAVEHLVEVR